MFSIIELQPYKLHGYEYFSLDFVN